MTVSATNGQMNGHTPHAPRWDRDAVLAALQGRALDVLADVAGIDRQILDGRPHGCPWCGTGEDRFRVIDLDKGAARCNVCHADKCGDALAAVMKAKGVGFPEALRLVGEYLGVPPVERPGKAGKSIGDRIAFDDEPNRGAVEAWARRKIGASADAAFRAGVRTGFYPATGRDRALVVAFPASLSPGAEPVAWTVLRVDGETIKGAGGKPAKSVNVKGSRDGWIVAATPDEFAKAHAIVKVEGPTDLCAAVPLLPDEFVAITNVCGAKSGRAPVAFLTGKQLIIIGDADVPGQDGARKLARRAKAVASEVLTVSLPYEVVPDHGKDLRDFVNEGGDVAALLAVAEMFDEPALPSDDRLRVEVCPAEYRTIAEAIEALGMDPDVWQRGCRLVRVVSDPSAGNADDDPTPRVESAPLAYIRERVTRFARFVEAKEIGENVVEVEVHPPRWCVEAIYQRGEYPNIRPLRGISTVPVLRRDGSIVTAPGYDPATRIVYVPVGEQPVIPDAPTPDDAAAAVAMLCDLVLDFPFGRPEHRSAWIAALVTIVARYAFRGPAPLFLVDANVRGSGKGKLINLIGRIVFGYTIPSKPLPATDDETRKLITTLALAARPVVNIDNIGGGLGCPSLDAALTAENWTDRLLGTMEEVTVPLTAVWLASGNNVALMADTARRVCPIRLESPLERPEERTGFRHPDIEAHVRESRAVYLGAVLTLVRAWFVAGKPTRTLPTWGSFEGWSGVVRQAIVWAGLPDPFAAREVLMSTADREAGTLSAFVHGWADLAADLEHEEGPRELTAGEIIKRLEAKPDKYRTLRVAVDEMAVGRSGKASPVTLGRRLGTLRGRVVSGRAIDGSTYQGVSRWTVRAVAQPHDPHEEGSAVGIGGGCGVVQAISTHAGARTHAHARPSGAVTTPQPPPTPRDGFDFDSDAGESEVIEWRA